MPALRKMKLLTFLLLLVFLTSFFLNYTSTVMTTNWLFRKILKLPQRPCTCSRCIGDLEVSSWFAQRFNQTMQPVLTVHNSLLEEDTYSWWRKLQREKIPRNLNDTIRELFSLVPGDTDPMLDNEAVGCRRCAVVGNSGNLKASQYGAQIDEHDFVLSSPLQSSLVSCIWCSWISRVIM